MTRQLVTLLTVLLAAATTLASETSAAPSKFTKPPTAGRTAEGKVKIAFALDRETDVEVSILDADGKVVRHLVAGVLGAKAPPPAPLKVGLSQELEWDGEDDYGGAARGGPFKIRVRAGMGVKLEKIAGGDPYAFYSKESGEGDHFQWGLTGLEAKPDGNVYVMGNTHFYGAQVIRQYDAAGNYVKTVFPPPAGKSVEEVKGWGVNVREDGTFTLKNGEQWKSCFMGTAQIGGGYGKILATLAPSPAPDKLVLQMPPSWFATVGTIYVEAGTDGTLKDYKPSPFFGGAALPPENRLRGPCYAALSPDRKHLYVSGIHSFQRKQGWGRIESVDTTGYWRDGQVWRLDLATREMSVFFALDEKTLPNGMDARLTSPICDQNYINPAAALHGVAVDPAGRVFVCDRLNKRVVVLDAEGKQLAELPVEYPDAVGVNPKSKTVYVTTRYGGYDAKGRLELLKFNDWSKDRTPSAKLLVQDHIGRKPQGSKVAVIEHDGQVLVWVAYTTLPVRIFRDTGNGFEMTKDFYESGQKQRCLDLCHMQVDWMTEDVYFADGSARCFRIVNWEDPVFELCLDGDRIGKAKGGAQDSSEDGHLLAAGLALDVRNRYLYAHITRPYDGRVRRYELTRNGALKPAPVGTSDNLVTTTYSGRWGFSGLKTRGMAVAPDGGLGVLGSPDSYTGCIDYWRPDKNKTPWQRTPFDASGEKGPIRGGIRFDPRGNLYVGWNDKQAMDLPASYRQERDAIARIYKYAPTGSLKSGCLYPTPPAKPAKVYDVRLSPLPAFYQSPRFGVDGYGRIYYPSGIESRVGIIDNEGNSILTLGTWGNRDSMGGLEGDLVPTKDVPLSCPNSVDATDEYIYVADMTNIRLLRLRKTFAAAETAKID